jgi:hypothetical protein
MQHKVAIAERTATAQLGAVPPAGQRSAGVVKRILEHLGLPATDPQLRISSCNIRASEGQNGSGRSNSNDSMTQCAYSVRTPSGTQLTLATNGTRRPSTSR